MARFCSAHYPESFSTATSELYVMQKRFQRCRKARRQVKLPYIPIQLTDLSTIHDAGHGVGCVILNFRGYERCGNNKPIELREYYQIRIFSILVFCSKAVLSYILLILMIHFIYHYKKLKIFSFQKQFWMNFWSAFLSIFQHSQCMSWTGKILCWSCLSQARKKWSGMDG